MSKLLAAILSVFALFGAAGCQAIFGTEPISNAAPALGPMVKGGQRPVLDVGLEGAWDGGHVHAPSVIRAGQGYMMWYDGTQNSDLYEGWGIGLATSDDGVTWAKDERNPVLSSGPLGAWDSRSVHDPRVLYDGQGYKMWYSGYDGNKWQIGYASSPDGITWARHLQNPVLSPGPSGDWDEADVAYSSVLKKGGDYLMWYQGRDYKGVWRIGNAVSKDGIRWVKSERNPVLAPGSQGDWDEERVFTPQVILWGNEYLMFYTGGPRWGIGYAHSKDGWEWKRGSGNPILTPGDPGQWDEAQVITLSARADGKEIKLWYAGSDGRKLRIGLAAGRVE